MSIDIEQALWHASEDACLAWAGEARLIPSSDEDECWIVLYIPAVAAGDLNDKARKRDRLARMKARAEETAWLAKHKNLAGFVPFPCISLGTFPLIEIRVRLANYGEDPLAHLIICDDDMSVAFIEARMLSPEDEETLADALQIADRHCWSLIKKMNGEDPRGKIKTFFD